ncbi:capsule biosynthesis GfcC family protein [Arsukibacterium indicum]|uniref:Capsule biosynthesis GfcC family protein n=1 Tax=Arsukibacterium indicum TaxID=2848612 RepID=A0ABS6MG38_9GAMM|nr:capsule biosynthesis GfcC family protein [Arsukibacterium indicum]MBV2127769.1 capsule biosynthesis GfcC family protein [Arsukibacterium indicum]
MIAACMRGGLVLLLISVLGFSIKLCAAEAVVSVQIKGQSYLYQKPPRLAEVLQPVAFTDDWFWPASRLYRLDTMRAEQLREQIIQRLAALKGKWQQDSHYQNTIEQLTFQLQQWQLAERIMIAIDYDLARLKPAANPLFEPGQYLLSLTERPPHITVFGLARAERITHYGNASVSIYAGQLRRLAGSNYDWLFVLQPDGEVIKAGIASWNQQHLELMPGAQLFVPFDTRFFGDEFVEINQAVIELARHRVL